MGHEGYLDGFVRFLLSILFLDLGGAGKGLDSMMFVFSIWSRIFAILGVILTTYLVISEKVVRLAATERSDTAAPQEVTEQTDVIVSADVEKIVASVKAMPVIMTYKGVNVHKGTDSYHIIVRGTTVAIEAEYNIKPTIDYWLAKDQA